MHSTRSPRPNGAAGGRGSAVRGAPLGDAERLARSDSATVTVSINDVNEAPTLENTARSIGENANEDDNIGAPLVATDPDSSATLRYFITGGTGNDGSWEMNSENGEIELGFNDKGTVEIDTERKPRN